MIERPSLLEQQEPLTAHCEANPASAGMSFGTGSRTPGHDDPGRVRIGTACAPVTMRAAGLHPFAGGVGELPSSGQLLLSSLAVRRGSAAGTVFAAPGAGPDTLVAHSAIRTTIAIAADAVPERPGRLSRRADKYQVVASSVRQSPEMTLEFEAAPAAAGSE